MKLFNAAGKTGNTDVGEGLLTADCYESNKKFSFRRFVSKFNSRRYSYLLYAFLLPVILNYLVYLSMGLHPFGNGSVLVLDLNGQYVYFYEALRNAVYGETSLIYSFCRTLGGEFFGIYAYYVASPFSYIVCLFPQERILEALLTIFLLKAGISGMTMAYYLDRISSKLNKVNVVTFSVLYAMCAYAVVQQHNSMWIDALMWLPLLVLGIESIVKEGKFKLYTVMLALIVMSNFYIGYMSCIFTFIYFFCYYFSRNEKVKEGNRRNNPKGEKHHFVRSLLRIGVFSAIGLGIAMVVLATAVYSLQFGKNTFSDPDFSFSLRFDLLDFFTRLLPGAYDTVRPEGLPFIYCGVITLFCIPAYFFSKKFTPREKAFSAILLVILFLSFSINTVDMIWHGFQKPNWLNYRYSFMMSFVMVVLGYKGFSEIKKLSSKVIAAIGAAGIFFVAVAQKFNFESYVDRLSGDVEFNQKLEELEIIWFSALCFAVFTVLLCVLIRSKHSKGICVVICVFVCIEAYANAIAIDSEFGEDVIYSTYSSYNDFISALRPVCDEILEEDTGFYRFEKNAHRKYCDNMALNIRGLTNSTSTLNKSTIEFLANIGYASKSHWSKYLGYTPLNDSLIGMKYVIATEDDTQGLYYEKTDIQSCVVNGKTYYVYKNPYALSLAYAVGDDVATIDIEDDATPMITLNRLVSAMVGSTGINSYFEEVEYTVTTSNCNESTIAGHTKYTHIKESADATITYSFTMKEDGEVFFYLPTDYWREVQVRVNGKSLGNFYSSENSRIFSLGVFDAGEDVNLNLTLDCDVLYVMNGVCSVYTLDMDLVEQDLTALASEQVNIEEGWTSTDLTGTITTTADNRLIQTTLPYDEGWKIYVDGDQVEMTETLDALCAFRIDTAGEHTVEFIYSPTCFTLGIVVSVSSFALFILIIIFEKKLRLALDRIFNGKYSLPEGPSNDDEEPWDTTEYKLVDIFDKDKAEDPGDGDVHDETQGKQTYEKSFDELNDKSPETKATPESTTGDESGNSTESDGDI